MLDLPGSDKWEPHISADKFGFSSLRDRWNLWKLSRRE